MARYLGWLANTVCFVLCCFFAARTVNAVIGSALSGAPHEAVAAPSSELVADATWSDREVILSRNLFNASLLAPAGAAIEQDLEATRLPLTLLGTVSALEPENAWAAIEDRDSRETRVVKTNEEIRPGVPVTRIERKRVVLMENGSPRELLLAEDEVAAAAVPAARPFQGRRAAFANRRPPAGRMPELVDNAAETPVRNPAALFSQARLLPKYENGQMVGIEINAIKAGSAFETIGLVNGDVITELNGTTIDSPEASASVMMGLMQSETVNLRVKRGGTVQNLSGPMPPAN
jgi:general secretion pathway protein C